MACEFTTTRRVEFFETDMAGIVHFANFYRWMELTEHDFFRSLGLSIMQEQPDGTIIGWPRVSANCSFEAPARYEDLVEISLRVQRIGVKSLTMDFEFRIDGNRIARGRMKTVCCRFGHGLPLRSVEIPPEYLDRIQEAPADGTSRG